MAWVSRLKQHGWPALGGAWPANGIPSSWLPRYSIAKVRESITSVPCDIAVRLLAILVGVFVVFTSQALLDQWLWKVTAGGMIAKEPFC